MHEIGVASVRLDGFVHTHNVHFLELRGQSVLRSLLAESLSRGHGGERKLSVVGWPSLELGVRLDCTVHDDAVGGTRAEKVSECHCIRLVRPGYCVTWYTLMAAAAAITSMTSITSTRLLPWRRPWGEPCRGRSHSTPYRVWSTAKRHMMLAANTAGFTLTPAAGPATKESVVTVGL